MKTLLKTAAATMVIVAAFSLGSCKKCTTCTYEVAGTSVSGNEVCGKKSEIDDYKATLETYSNVTCTDS